MMSHMQDTVLLPIRKDIIIQVKLCEQFFLKLTDMNLSNSLILWWNVDLAHVQELLIIIITDSAEHYPQNKTKK